MRLASLLSTVLLLAAIGPAGADTLQMPATAPEDAGTAPDGRPLVAMELPVKGMSMRQVEKRFGSPVKKVAAVGEPPIARWVYEPFTVYFEQQYVIHAVLNR